MISLFGYGNTTKGIAKKFAPCYIYDDSFAQKKEDKYGNILLPTNCFRQNKSTIEIVSPGIPPHHKLIKSAKNLISEYDFFYEDMPSSIWISGTNGKSTTTKMLYHMLKNKKVTFGGNIGKALASLDSNLSMWILETSSFTLHYTKIAHPNIYILLPISQDHISWHGSFNNYIYAKLKPLDKMVEGSVAIIPQAYKNYKTQAYKIPYKDEFDISKIFDINVDKIKHKKPFLMDAIMSLAVLKILFIEFDYKKINSFKIGEHCLEKIKDYKQRTWINDSKATNPSASIEGIRKYKNKKIYLIVGGDDKGLNLQNLFSYLRDIDVEIFAVGKSYKKIIELASKEDIEVVASVDIKNAVNKIDSLHTKNSIAMLSPACSSLDQFGSYKQRGNLFKEYIFSLK